MSMVNRCPHCDALDPYGNHDCEERRKDFEMSKLSEALVEQLAPEVGKAIVPLTGKCDWKLAKDVTRIALEALSRRAAGDDVGRCPNCEARLCHAPWTGWQSGHMSVRERPRLKALSADADRLSQSDLLEEIALMMSEFVDNWPNPKRIGTALALIAKTLREALHGA